MSATQRRILLPIMTFLLFLCAWQGITFVFKVPVYLMPSPTEIFAGGMSWDQRFSQTRWRR